MGLFIAFEGVDGSGKSTQAALLHKRLTEVGASVHLTAEPSNGPVGTLIRSAFSGRTKFTDDPVLFDDQISYLFAADRHDHLYNSKDGIIEKLNHGHVICDRYMHSSMVYQGGFDGGALVRKLNAEFREPDVVIYLDALLGTSVERIATRGEEDLYENQNKMLSVIRNYNNLFRTYEGDWLRVPAGQSVSNVHLEIVNYLTLSFNMDLGVDV